MLCALMLLSVIPLGIGALATSETNPFTDVPEGKWFTKGVLYCYEKGYVTGTSSDKFSPNMGLSRAMIVTILAKVDGAKTDDYADAETFNDVAKGKWFHNAIEWAAANEIASGVGNGKFNPNGLLTRQDLSLMIYKYAKNIGVDVSGQKDLSSFADFSKISSYAKVSMQWACYAGLISGTSATTVSPKGTATRSQAALIIMNFDNLIERYTITFDLNGGEGDIEESVSVMQSKSVYLPGDDEISRDGYTLLGWATDPDATSPGYAAPAYFTPKTNLDLYAVWKQDVQPSFTINGNDLSLYTIVYSADSEINGKKKGRTKNAATTLQTYLNEEFGTDLALVTDETAETEYEILVGTTNRENSEFTVDRDTTTDTTWTYQVIGNKFVIAGAVDAKNKNGTEHGVYEFLETYCGYNFYTDDVVTHTGSVVELEGGMKESGEYGLLNRAIYWGDYSSNDCYCTGDQYSTGFNIHNVCDLVDGTWDEQQGKIVNVKSNVSSKNPCMTSQANIDKAISNIRSYLAANPTKEAIWVSQNDSDSCCTCPTCKAFYQAHGGQKSSSLVNFVNAISDNLADDYPNLKIITLAYNYTLNPPSHAEGTTDMCYRDNVIVYFCPLRYCAYHSYFDTTCERNASLTESYAKWSQLASEIWIWDYSTDFSYGLTAFPSLHTMYTNTHTLYEKGVTGAFNNAVDCDEDSSASGEFGQLRAYLISELYKHPDMSAEEYDTKINGFLKAYYGAGWKSIREYIDLCETLVKDCTEDSFMGYYYMPSDIFNMSAWADKADEIQALWDKAYEKATTEEQKSRVELASISALYMNQIALYDSRYTNGTAAQKEAYCLNNDKLYNLIINRHVRLREQEDTTISFDRTISPEEWTAQ